MKRRQNLDTIISDILMDRVSPQWAIIKLLVFIARVLVDIRKATQQKDIDDQG